MLVFSLIEMSFLEPQVVYGQPPLCKLQGLQKTHFCLS